ncbi:hypothetical protein R5R35_005679 [Gryllus longicercus]|uniref:ASCH domain-containing protein n=1 Tax=Gryllus longicercus TaxID=2509291 RepID=A0AAN9VRE9_9ORTH
MGLSDWVKMRLSELLDFPVPQDLTEYIVSIENSRDLEEYLRNLLNFNEPRHRLFYQELLQQKRHSGVFTSSTGDVQGYKKPNVEDVYFHLGQSEKKKKNKGHSLDPSSSQKDQTPNQNQEEKEKKKKSKFVNLYSQDGKMRDTVMLKGRHHCDCQATKHKLINNCLECGRIVCEQEGSGPCFFCGNVVCTPEEKKLISTSSKKGEELYKKLMSQDKFGLDAALRQRNKLLEYDQTSEKRTKVIDDESDYYSLNSVWLSQKERETLKKVEEQQHAKRHASRLSKTVTLDFAGRQVLEEYDSAEITDLTELLQNQLAANMPSDAQGRNWDSTLHPRITCEKPIFQEQKNSKVSVADGSKNHVTVSRVQDKEYLEMSDEGFCLSMHQPWASLLVNGIKLHEGRVWYHSHRGRLWIAATAKPPDLLEVKQLEQSYRVLKGKDVKFPSHYPTSCLLGYVSVTDCLPQEEYRNRFPDGESDSPFVFICEDANELPTKFPIQGKHKIYKLEKKIHDAALKSVERITRIKANKANFDRGL